MSEATAAIDSCNRSNVAIYPIDVRGLIAGPLRMGNWETMQPPPGPFPLFTRPAGLALALDPVLRIAAFQARGGGGTGGGAGGGTSGGSTGGMGGARGGGSTGGSTGGSGTGAGAGSSGSRGAAGGTSGSRAGTTGGGGGGGEPSLHCSSGISAHHHAAHPARRGGPQSILYSAADGTGGFVIINTNDLLKGMESIGKEQNEYYFLGYEPPESKEGSCHVIHVKIDRGATNLRSRSGYCNVKSKDALAGKPIETQLETRITGSQAPTVAAPLQAVYFLYRRQHRQGHRGAQHSLRFREVREGEGQVSRRDQRARHRLSSASEVGARFSDTVKLDYDKKDEVAEFAEKPYHYENQFEISPGKYDLKVVFNSGGSNFGKPGIAHLHRHLRRKPVRHERAGAHPGLP